jgi:hypothetical protein
MKKVATPSEPDDAIPVVVIAVHIDLAFVVVPVEVSVALYRKPSMPPLLEIFKYLEVEFYFA